MDIKLNTENPITMKPYNIHPRLINSMKEEIDRLLRLNIIRPSTSYFSSPAFPIMKKNQKVRLVVDYRKISKATKKIAHPFPSIIDCLLDLKDSAVYSTLDLNNGYYQIPLSNSAIPKTGFVLPFGHWEFLRLPFGLTNAPKIFQKIINQAFSSFEFVKIFQMTSSSSVEIPKSMKCISKKLSKN